MHSIIPYIYLGIHVHANSWYAICASHQARSSMDCGRVFQSVWCRDICYIYALYVHLTRIEADSRLKSHFSDGALALSQIALILLVPRTLKPAQQRLAIYIWCGVTILLYSTLISIFKVKNAGETARPPPCAPLTADDRITRLSFPSLVLMTLGIWILLKLFT